MNEGTRVLVVEDSFYDRQLVKEKLEGRCNLTMVDCLTSAAKELREKDFDVIMLDMGLPDTAGDTDTISKIKALRKNAALVIISGNDDPTFIRDSIRGSANGYIVKGRQDRTYALIVSEIDRAIDNHDSFVAISKHGVQP